MKLWLNGKILPSATACIDPADRGLLLGDGVFETMAVKDSTVADLDRHYARLTAGAALLRLVVPLSAASLAAAISELLTENALTASVVRLTLTRGPGARGLLPPSPPQIPTILLTTAPPPPSGGPVRLITSTIRRDETSPLSAVKSLNYLPGVLARLEAAEQGADDAVLLNHAGHVAEASAATLFACLNGIWFTPPIRDGALPGICRAKLLDVGCVHERTLTRTDINRAEAISLGNVLGLKPVLALDGRVLPSLATPESDMRTMTPCS